MICDDAWGLGFCCDSRFLFPLIIFWVICILALKRFSGGAWRSGNLLVYECVLVVCWIMTESWAGLPYSTESSYRSDWVWGRLSWGLIGWPMNGLGGRWSSVWSDWFGHHLYDLVAECSCSLRRWPEWIVKGFALGLYIKNCVRWLAEDRLMRFYRRVPFRKIIALWLLITMRSPQLFNASIRHSKSSCPFVKPPSSRLSAHTSTRSSSDYS